MRTAFLIALAGAVTVGCSTHDVEPSPSTSAPAPAAEPASTGESVVTFEGFVNGKTGEMRIVYRDPTGAIVEPPSDLQPSYHPDAPSGGGGGGGGGGSDAGTCGASFQTLPYATSGTAGVYLHTPQAPRWLGDGGSGPPNLTGGVCPLSLYTNPVCHFTAYIDSVSPSSVALLAQPPGGGKSTGWICSNGSLADGGVSKGIPVCHVDMGTVTGTGTCTTTPFVFNDPTSADFTFIGHVMGDLPSH